MLILWCMHYVFDVCNTEFTVYYLQILVWFGINYTPQGTMELLLRDDFGLVRYACYQQITCAAQYNTWLLIKLTPKGAVFFFLFFSYHQIMQHLFADDWHSVSPAKSSHLSSTAVH